MSSVGGHRVQRAFERYGVKLFPDDLAAMERLCTPATLMRRDEERGGGAHVIRYGGKTFVVAASAQGRILTFLPPNYFVERANAGKARTLSKAGKVRTFAKARKFARRIGRGGSRLGLGV